MIPFDNGVWFCVICFDDMVLFFRDLFFWCVLAVTKLCLASLRLVFAETEHFFRSFESC